MTVAKWNLMTPSPRICSLDGILTTSNFTNSYNCGLLYISGSKSALRRPLCAFDLLTAPSVGVNPFPSSAVINSAYIEADCFATIGSVSQAGLVDRITKSDWDKTVATWTIYKTATNWASAGGDVDVVTPAEVTWTTPAGAGAFTIPGLLGLVNDAIANRGGLVNLLIRMSDETNNGVQRWHSADPVTMLLVVDYTARTLVPRRSRSARALLVR